MYSLKGMFFINDICNLGFVVGFIIESYSGEFVCCFFELVMKLLEKGFYVCYGGDIL